MGFYSIAEESENDSSDLPWLNEYLEVNGKTKEGLFYLANSVKATKKGYIITTPNFNAWVWRNSASGKALAQGLTDSVQTDSYPQLAVMVKLKSKDKFLLGFLDDVMAEYVWDSDNSTYKLLEQKNLPLEEPPSTEVQPSTEVPTGKRRTQS